MGDRPDCRLILGDCLTVMPTLEAESVDSIVTDPPSSIAFMAKSWDTDKGGRDKWVAWLASVMAEGLRCLKPGGYALVWALPRRSHWTAMALEDAGFEIRDRIAHIFGQGFPKSKACLKPAVEDWWLARKPGPLSPLQIDACRVEGKWTTWRRTDGTICPSASSPAPMDQAGDVPRKAQSQEHPSGRWPSNLALIHHPDCRPCGTRRVKGSGGHYDKPRSHGGIYAQDEWTKGKMRNGTTDHADPDGLETVAAYECHPQCAVRRLDLQAGERKSGGRTVRDGEKSTGIRGNVFSKHSPSSVPSSGSASRFFPTFAFDADDFFPALYTPKASRSERNAGLEGMPEKVIADDKWATKDRRSGTSKNPHPRDPKPKTNFHPTVKPLQLCEWLIKLVTPPGGVVLDPFMGSGSIGVASVNQGFRFIGVEMDPEYLTIAEARINHVTADMPLFAGAKD